MSDGWRGGASRRIEDGISWIELSHLFSTFYFSLSTFLSAVGSIAWLDALCESRLESSAETTGSHASS